MGAWSDELREVADTPEPSYLLGLLGYIAKVSGRAALEEVRSVLVEGAPQKEAIMITAADEFRQEGFERGKLDGKRDMVRRAAQTKFGALSDTISALVAGASEDALDRLIERVIAATSIDEVIEG